MHPTSNHAACPEKQLLVRCSTTRHSEPRVNENRPLTEAALDWDFLVSQAGENAVTPLLHRHLSATGPYAAPPEHLARLQEIVRASAVRSLMLTAELIRILDALAAAQIEAFPYKGPILAVQAYGDLALREFADIDLVLRQRDVAGAHEALAHLGLSPQFPPIFAPGRPSSLIPGEYDYHDRSRGLVIELHTERTLRHFPLAPDLDDLSRRAEPVSISGHEIRTFSLEDTLVFLCVHGSKDFWEKLLWIADVAELIAAHPRLDWEGVEAFAGSVRARRMLHLGIALADRLFGLVLPHRVRSRVEGDRVAASIASAIRHRTVSRSAPALGAREAFQYRRSMMGTTLAGWRYGMRLTTAPAVDDWRSIRLTRSLAPLYAAVRPFRLLWKYGVSQSRAAGPPMR